MKPGDPVLPARDRSDIRPRPGIPARRARPARPLRLAGWLLWASTVAVSTRTTIALSPVVAAPAGCHVRFIPDRVRPGQLFELRVDRRESTLVVFELQLPDHPQLVQVDRNSSPVRYEQDHYVQSESVWLQARSSGPITLSGVRLRLSDRAGQQELELRPLVLEVVPFSESDRSDTPARLPRRPSTGSGMSSAQLWLRGLLATLVVLCLATAGCWYVWRRRANRRSSRDDLSRPKSDSLPSRLQLERLYAQAAGRMPPELRTEIEQCLYRRGIYRKDPAHQSLIDRLLREAQR